MSKRVRGPTHIVTIAVAKSNDLVTGGTAWMMDEKSAMSGGDQTTETKLC